MGMSTFIKGFRPPDKEWEKMKKVWDSCTDAGLEVPEEVQEFFNWEAPDKAGVEVEIPEHEYQDSENAAEGIEIHVDEIPKGVKIIRFVNSW